MSRGSPRRLRGVFIGIDQYRSPAISELRYAERDARALHALFCDTFGEGAELLVGEAASREDLCPGDRFRVGLVPRPPDGRAERAWCP